ncbi:MAG: transcription elongation factor [Candidatus Thorarchaeota archaeon]
MGRKLHRKVITRPRPSLPRIFECPKCEAEAVKIDLKETHATIICGNCHINKTFSDLKRVYDKVDIYGMWIDEYYAELPENLEDEQEIESNETSESE